MRFQVHKEAVVVVGEGGRARSKTLDSTQECVPLQYAHHGETLMYASLLVLLLLWSETTFQLLVLDSEGVLRTQEAGLRTTEKEAEP